MFILHSTNGTLVLLLYVDDIILTGNNDDLVTRFISRLGQEFSMTDLGEIHYFLGIEATRTDKGLFLSQSKYTIDLLHYIGMVGCKPCVTPVPSGSKLSACEGTPLLDSKEYKQIVGTLQYLTLTRPDVSYVVKHMHAPTTSHLEAVKRILRYLKHIIGAVTLLQAGPLDLTVAYTDVDWAGCPDTQRSTTGFCTFMGPNLISWGSKKQPIVSRSSSEAKYKALAVTVSEMMWLSYILNDLHIASPQPMVVYCDNISATCMV
ncbi:uncharacterized mitochondrial protein AtMg00810-like [Macadamia integrifolia]|uniref:uncharacterized mitochondrial protein AtMg00810-like n=1 Tax=Macadamia integrifolia TaxID=60698 RepID=UPI001C4F01C1|nr:uncharacterized mitochondrial protein AtMg00810-like [Macadamia integrifolia]